MVANGNCYLYAWNGWIVKNLRLRSNDNKLHRNEHVTVYGTCWCYGSSWCHRSLYPKNINLWSVNLVFCYVRSSCRSHRNVRRSWNICTSLLGSGSLGWTLFENLYQVILKKIIKTCPYGWVFLFYHIFINKIKNYEK